MSQTKTNSNFVLPIVTRPYCLDDVDFIRQTWIGSFGSDKTRARRYRAIKANRDILKFSRGWDDPSARIIVAHLTSAPDLPLGWAAAIGDTLYYVFVAAEWRCQGIARQLIAALGLGAKSPIMCANMTRYAKKIARTHPGVLKEIKHVKHSKQYSQKPQAKKDD